MKLKTFSIASISLCLLLGALTTQAQAPNYKFDPDWPKLPLPNKWWMQGVTGLYVDNDDNIWVLNRPSNLSNTEDYAQLDPPTAECCVAPPTVIAFDIEGNVIQSWDTREGHGMMVDRNGFVWIGSDTVRKFTSGGQLVGALERVPDIQNNTVRILNRDDGTVVARVGSAGDNGGQFHGLHMAAVDSLGNLYTGEVQNGERVQRFVLVD